MRAELERILASPGFVDAGRLGPFLTFLVDAALSGDTSRLKESVLGVEVFQRQPGYNSASDPIVRVEARRLRSRLEEYYAGPGKDDPVVIELPRGAYVPVFRTHYQPSAGRKLFMFGLCLAGLIGVWVFYWFANKQAVESPPNPGAASLLVLPFANQSPEKDNEYFAQGLTTELTDALTKVEGMRVVSYGAGAQVPDVREAGKRFHTAAVLEGSVRKSGDRLRITVQLVDTGTGVHLWSQSYERELKDVFAIQEEIARAIANAMRVQLRIDPKRALAAHNTQNLAAYNLYLRGRYHFYSPHSDDDLNKGVGYFEQAIQADPGFATGYAALSSAYVILGYYRLQAGSEAWPKAKAAALKAIEIDNSLAEAHASLGFVKAVSEYDWAGSEREFRRALELNPGSADTHNGYAIAYLTPTGHLDAARNESRLGVDLDPLSFFPNYSAAWILLASRQYDAAIEQYRKALDLSASVSDAWWDLGMAYGYAGKPQQAMEMFRHSGQMREGGGWEPGVAELALTGRMDEARRKTAALKGNVGGKCCRQIDTARAYALVGDKDNAFASLEKAFAEHDTQLIWLKVDPRYDNIRSDARFPALLKRVGLE